MPAIPQCPAILHFFCNRLTGLLLLTGVAFHCGFAQAQSRDEFKRARAKMVELSVIEDYLCENCEQRVDIQKRSLVAETPNVLIVHL